MADKYDHQAIEKKWQKRWEEEKVFAISNQAPDPRSFVLDMFPYPSADGLHVGHPEGYTATDIFSRYQRMKGVQVLHPMGWDAFGLPAENFAIKKGVHPREVTEKNITNFKRQIQSLGFSYDWAREVNTTDPKYYKWTQWIFLQLFKKGLAYEKEAPIWWCPKDKTGLANEEVVNGKCDRCGTVVEKKMLKQWMLKITTYADRLLNGLEKLDWPEGIKALQRNWIGRSQGAEVMFQISNAKHAVLLHGFTGSPQVNFFPWLKNKLEARGFSVEVPALPNSENPTVMEQVEYVEQNCMFDQETILLGHSLGAPVALKVIERLRHPIAKLVLVAGFTTPVFEDHERPFASSFDWKFDWKKIRKHVGEVIILHDRNDSAVGEAQAKNLGELLEAPVNLVTAAKDHFCAQEEPIILENILHEVAIFTTRPDTLFGATYLVLAPEHALVSQITIPKQKKAVEKYVKSVAAKSDIERTALEKEKTGVFTGAYAVNPVNGEKIPVWIADYVLATYGTGAIMAVPGHDERDLAFATKFDLPIIEVVRPDYDQLGDPTATVTKCWTGEGTLMNSADFDGTLTEEARKKIIDLLAQKKQATFKVQYKLRDWVFSRQRYWGEPIPLVHCEKDGVVPVPEKDLPVLLPDVKKYEPTGTGESPLAGIEEWVNTTCPKCGGPAKRETNTMPQWAGSCWYYLRFCDPQNNKEFASAEALKSWLPVDVYVGGAEHAVLHLLYARFWHKALFDAKKIPEEVGDEPFLKLKNQGLILGPDGEKMSKSRGNVINPDEIVKKYGADTLRMYEMFMGPFEDAKPWDTNGIVGVRRFLDRVWRIGINVDTKRVGPLTWPVTAKKISDGIENFKFNTCVSDLMKWVNTFESKVNVAQNDFEGFLKLLYPFAPHISEELWSHLGHTTLLAEEKWPTYDPALLKVESVTIAIQVNGKHRGNITVATGSNESMVREAAEAIPNVKKFLNGVSKKVIFVKNRLINFVQ